MALGSQGPRQADEGGLFGGATPPRTDGLARHHRSPNGPPRTSASSSLAKLTASERMGTSGIRTRLLGTSRSSGLWGTMGTSLQFHRRIGHKAVPVAPGAASVICEGDRPVPSLEAESSHPCYLPESHFAAGNRRGTPSKHVSTTPRVGNFLHLPPPASTCLESASNCRLGVEQTSGSDVAQQA